MLAQLCVAGFTELSTELPIAVRLPINLSVDGIDNTANDTSML